jgi:hypothetical protein
LVFAKHTAPQYVNNNKEVSLISLLNPPQALASALEELRDAKLIRWSGRFVAVHRVVQGMRFADSSHNQKSDHPIRGYELPQRQGSSGVIHQRYPACLCRYVELLFRSEVLMTDNHS